MGSLRGCYLDNYDSDDNGNNNDNNDTIVEMHLDSEIIKRL